MQALVNRDRAPGREEDAALGGLPVGAGLRGAVAALAPAALHRHGSRRRPVDRVVSGYHAGLVQHECDHLDGILYPARMTDFGYFGFNEEMAKYPPDMEAPR
jgi:peptide deformylase